MLSSPNRKEDLRLEVIHMNCSLRRRLSTKRCHSFKNHSSPSRDLEKKSSSNSKPKQIYFLILRTHSDTAWSRRITCLRRFSHKIRKTSEWRSLWSTCLTEGTPRLRSNWRYWSSSRCTTYRETRGSRTCRRNWRGPRQTMQGWKTLRLLITRKSLKLRTYSLTAWTRPRKTSSRRRPFKMPRSSSRTMRSKKHQLMSRLQYLKTWCWTKTRWFQFLKRCLEVEALLGQP